jgi:hypothetical protein
MVMNAVKCRAICFGFAAVALLSGCGYEPKGGSVSEIHAGDNLTSFSQEITSSIHEFQVKPGGSYTVPISVKNTGTQPWFGGKQATSVDAGYRWIDGKGNVLPIEGNRAELDRPSVQPGESDQLKLQVTAPPDPGSYTLWISMVQEGVAWFYAQGTKPLVLQVAVK